MLPNHWIYILCWYHRMSVTLEKYPVLEAQYELHETLGAGAVCLCSLASCHDLMIFHQVGLQRSRKVCTDSLERRWAAMCKTKVGWWPLCTNTCMVQVAIKIMDKVMLGVSVVSSDRKCAACPLSFSTTYQECIGRSKHWRNCITSTSAKCFKSLKQKKQFVWSLR